LPKWIGQLGEETGRNGIALDAEGGRLPVARHVQGPEGEVDEREQAGEVLVQALGLGRVCQRWKTGLDTTRRSGPKLQGRLAGRKIAWKVRKGT
jgi:hypothetical protein